MMIFPIKGIPAFPSNSRNKCISALMARCRRISDAMFQLLLKIVKTNEITETDEGQLDVGFSNISVRMFL